MDGGYVNEAIDSSNTAEKQSLPQSASSRESSPSPETGSFSLKNIKLKEMFRIEFYSKQRIGGQLKTKNGQKYVFNGPPEGYFISKSCVVLAVICALVAIILTVLITYFSILNSINSIGCTNGNTGGDKLNHINDTAAIASMFGMPPDMSAGPTLQRHDIFGNSEAKFIDRKLQLHEGWIPEHYRLIIEPNLETSTNNGTISIEMRPDFKFTKLQPIVLDVNNITIADVRVVYGSKNDAEVEFDSDYSDDNSSFVIKLQKDVINSKDLSIIVFLDFVSQLTDTLQGIYKTSYTNPDTLEKEWMISTQFSPIDARRAFPCFDRPDKKANFTISIIHQNTKTMALSNMPAFRTSPYRAGYVKEDFLTTPKMPTYLVAFVISSLVRSNFSIVEANLVPRVEIWTRPENTEMTQYAYRVIRRVLPFYEKYFEIKNRLPKIDFVSVPDFGFGAMENWGLITFRDSALLVPEDTEKASSSAHTEYVSMIIAHELAHQWFGNLVTPKWWNDLWLKEGFATYLSYIATNYAHPEWMIMDRFTVFEFQSSMNKDSDNSSHAISLDVKSTNDIRRIFDPISYSKGTILLRMVNSIVGDDAFRDAIIELLKTFSYQNVDHNDLWHYMTVHGHAKKTLPAEIHVNGVMHSWISQAGYPVVTVERILNDTGLIISQQRYLLPAKNRTDNTKWVIPITFETDEMKKGDTIPTHWMGLDDRQIIIEDVFSSDNNSENVVYMNLNRQGYYRVNYDYSSWIALKKKFSSLPRVTRAQLLDDSLHLARAEYLSYDIPLTFLLEMFTATDDELLWAAAQDGLSYLIYMIHREPAYENFRALMRFIVRPAFEKYGLEEPENESHIQLMHRARVVGMACKFSHDRCTNAAQLRYREWMRDPKANHIKPNLKHAIYCTALAEGSFQEWYFAYKQYKKTTSASEKEQILSSLGCTAKPWLLSKYLNMTIDPTSGILKQDGVRAFTAVAVNPIGYEIAFDFLSTNIKEISEYFGDGFSTLSKMIDSVTTYMNKDYHKEQLQRFAERARSMGLKSVETAIQLAMEQVNNNIYWRKRSYYNLKGFLETIVSEFHINIF